MSIHRGTVTPTKQKVRLTYLSYAKTEPKTSSFYRYEFGSVFLAGSTSRAGNPLLADFLLVGQKLEKLGFTYYKDKVIIIEPEAAEPKGAGHA